MLNKVPFTGVSSLLCLFLQPMFRLFITSVFILLSFLSQAQPFINDTTYKASFSTSSGIRGVYTFLPLTKGRLLVGGAFQTYNAVSASFCVLTDTSGNLIRTLPFNNTVYKVDTTVDGYLMIAGAFDAYNGYPQNRIIKIDTMGNLAPGWQNPGINGAIRDFKIQNDGKIIIAGEFSATDSFNRVARLHANGSVDTSFKTWPGIQLTTTGTPFAMQVGLQTSGKTVVTGYFNQYSGISANGIVRLNPDGSYDHSFQTGTGSQVGSNPASVNALAIKNDTLYIGGNFTSFNGMAIGRFVRILPDGTTDTAFAQSIGTTGFSSTVTSILPLENNRILVGGVFTSYKGLSQRRLCLLNNGSIDYTFINTGTTFGINPTGASVNFIQVNPRGDAYVGITTSGGFPTFNNVTCNHLIRIGNGSAYLPVSWLNFNVVESNGHHLISWSTAAEHNSHYFEIEQSGPDLLFYPVAQIKGAGNSTKTIHYAHSLLNQQANNQKVYYRIKQVDSDGRFSLSNIVSLNQATHDPAFSVYPNPVSSGTVYISCSPGSDIELMDHTGQKILGLEIPATGTIILHTATSLKNGIYFIHNTKTGQSLKFIKY